MFCVCARALRVPSLRLFLRKRKGRPYFLEHPYFYTYLVDLHYEGVVACVPSKPLVLVLQTQPFFGSLAS